MQFTFLGTGTSHGVPMIGCTCAVCTSDEVKNYRRRCSLYVVAEGQHLLFDTSPDLREQVLRFGVSRVDAIFLTHEHADHIYGFDDVRRFSTLQDHHIPVFAAPETIQEMRNKYDYIDRASYGFESVPRVIFTDMNDSVSVGNCAITPLPVYHGKQIIYGFMVEGDGKRLGYMPDCNGIPDTTLELMKSLDAMILDGLRPEKHPTHFSTDECIEQLSKIGARQSFITHLTHNVDHYELQEKVGPQVTVPWDGLCLEL